MKIRILATVLAALMAASPAVAQQAACGERDKIIERLTTKYGEERQSMGLNHNNGVLEVFASPQTGTWTIIVTMPTGRTCLIAAGDYWEAEAEDLAQVGNPV